MFSQRSVCKSFCPWGGEEGTPHASWDRGWHSGGCGDSLRSPCCRATRRTGRTAPRIRSPRPTCSTRHCHAGTGAAGAGVGGTVRATPHTYPPPGHAPPHLPVDIRTHPLLVTSAGHHWRPVQACSLEAIPFPSHWYWHPKLADRTGWGSGKLGCLPLMWMRCTYHEGSQSNVEQF